MKQPVAIDIALLEQLIERDLAPLPQKTLVDEIQRLRVRLELLPLRLLLILQLLLLQYLVSAHKIEGAHVCVGQVERHLGPA